MSYTVVMTAPDLAQAGRDVLDAAGCRTLFFDGSADGLADFLAAERPDAVISRTLPLTARAIAASPDLKVVSRHGVGYNNVDLAAATARGIPVLVADGTNAQSVAELTIGLMLAAARSVASHDAAIREGLWSRAVDGFQLRGRTLGLVAFGAIARLVAEMAHGIGMRVLAYDPFLTAAPGGVELVATLGELLDQTDVLSLHCPLTAETRGLIGRTELVRLKKGAIVVNTARGGLVDEAALAEALGAGHVFAAGLDTFAAEPLPSDHPLRALRQVVMTPHMGGSTDAALAASAASAARNVLAVLRNEGVDRRLVVNPDVFAGHAAA